MPDALREADETVIDRTFTAAEVQAAIEAVILYERARTARLLRGVRADVSAVEHAEHRTLTPAARRKLATLDQRNP